MMVKEHFTPISINAISYIAVSFLIYSLLIYLKFIIITILYYSKFNVNSMHCTCPLS